MTAKLKPGDWGAIANGSVLTTGPAAADVGNAGEIGDPADNAIVGYLPDNRIEELVVPELLRSVLSLVSADTNMQAWLVGGAVRDFMLRREVKDFDFAVLGDALVVGRGIAKAMNGAFFVLDKERGAARVIVECRGRRNTLDFTRIRGETIVEDLLDRDFTINAMALPLDCIEQLVDPTGGAGDLRDRVVRATHRYSVMDDPIRAVRAVRFASALGFRIDVNTQAMIRTCARYVQSSSAERLRDELLECLTGYTASAAAGILDALDVLAEIVPEAKRSDNSDGRLGLSNHASCDYSISVVRKLEGILGVLGPDGTLEGASQYVLGTVAARLGRYGAKLSKRLNNELTKGRSRRSLLMLAALLHPATNFGVGAALPLQRIEMRDVELVRKRAAELRMSSREVAWLTNIAGNELGSVFENRLTRREIHRFFRSTGDTGIEVCLLSIAALAASWGTSIPQTRWWDAVDSIAVLMDAYFERYQEVVCPIPLVNGADIMRVLRIEEGPTVGRILRDVTEAQAGGEVSTRKEAVELALKLGRRESED